MMTSWGGFTSRASASRSGTQKKKKRRIESWGYCLALPHWAIGGWGRIQRGHLSSEPISTQPQFPHAIHRSSIAHPLADPWDWTGAGERDLIGYRFATGRELKTRTLFLWEVGPLFFFAFLVPAVQWWEVRDVEMSVRDIGDWDGILGEAKGSKL